MRRCGKYVICLLASAATVMYAWSWDTDHSSSIDSQVVDQTQNRIVYRWVFPEAKEEGPIIEFTSAPAFVHSLKIAPRMREPELNRGKWVVLACGYCSVPDVAMISIAIRSVAEIGGGIRLGVRPLGDYEEMSTWLPEYNKYNSASPIWVILQDGKTLNWRTGPMSEDRVKTFIREYFP